jgi:Flp pilus assembly protein TadB
VPSRQNSRRDQAHLVTEARQSRSAEIGQRERRYLVMMGVRLVCFVIAVVLVVNHAGWIAIVPAAGAIALPYFAVIVANSRRQVGTTGFRPYSPRLPERYVPPDAQASGPPDGQTPENGTP